MSRVGTRTVLQALRKRHVLNKLVSDEEGAISFPASKVICVRLLGLREKQCHEITSGTKKT